MNKFFYETKPLIMIAVGVLALLQPDNKYYLIFKVSGALLVFSGTWALTARLKYRGYFDQTKSVSQNQSEQSNDSRADSSTQSN